MFTSPRRHHALGQRGEKPLYQPPARQGEKFYRRILGGAGRHRISRGYVRDYSGPLSDIVRSLIAEKYQRRTDNPLDPAIRRQICQEAQDQWKILLDFYDRATNPKRYWSLLRKMGGKKSNPTPPNISIFFELKIHSSSKAIAQAFNRQFTVQSVSQDWIGLVREIHHHQPSLWTSHTGHLT